MSIFDTINARKPVVLTRPRDYDLADWYHERIEEWIVRFRKDVAKGQQVMARIILADGTSLRATWFGYHNPDMLVIDGIGPDGEEMRALLPKASIQIVLSSVPATKRKSRIGFQTRSVESTSSTDSGI